MPEKTTDSFHDEIRVKGIKSLGYGQLAKYPMLDPDLSIEAKAIYAYFCSYTGSGHNECFPSRDKIISDLGISKDRYYRHYSQLINEGYISVEQKKESGDSNRFTHNVYYIEIFPPKFNRSIPAGLSDYQISAFQKVQAVKDIFAAGYGIIPKSVMLEDLPIEAKGIYAFFCTFTGQDYTAVPDSDFSMYYCKIGHNAYSKYIKILFTNNLLIKKSCGVNGKFGKVIYYMNQKLPTTSKADKTSEIITLPYTQYKDTGFKDAARKDSENKDSRNPDTSKTDTKIKDTNKKTPNKTKTNKNNISSSINPSNESPLEILSVKPQTPERTIDLKNTDLDFVINDILTHKHLPDTILSSPDLVTGIIRYLTDWDFRCSDSFYSGSDAQFRSKIYKLFVEALSEMLVQGSSTYVRGTRISNERVFKCLCENYLEFSNTFSGEEFATLQDLPDEVCDEFIQAGKSRKITNVKAYMKTIIWTVLQASGTKGIVDFLNAWNS